MKIHVEQNLNNLRYKFEFDNVTREVMCQLAELAKANKLFVCDPNILDKNVYNFDEYTKRIVDDFKSHDNVDLVLRSCLFYFDHGTKTLLYKNYKSFKIYYKHIFSNVIELYEELSFYLRDFLIFYIENKPFRFLLQHMFFVKHVIDFFYKTLSFDNYKVIHNSIIKNSSYFDLLDSMADGLLYYENQKKSFVTHLECLLKTENTYEKESIKRLLKRINTGKLNWWPYYYKFTSGLNEKQIELIFNSFMGDIFFEETKYPDFSNLFKGDVYLMYIGKIFINNHKLNEFVYLLNSLFKENIDDSKLGNLLF